jgi:hypothetical protein
MVDRDAQAAPIHTLYEVLAESAPGGFGLSETRITESPESVDEDLADLFPGVNLDA